MLKGISYTTADLDRLSLRDILRFEKETAEANYPLSWAEITMLVRGELAALPDNMARALHPGTYKLLAATVYATKCLAGENPSWAESIDFGLDELKNLPDTTDRAKPANPTAARKRKPAAKASAPGARAARAPRAASQPRTSRSPSTAG
jgi:hypothetical protein